MSIEIDHLGIAVRNLEESLRFYEQVLGLEATDRETIDVEQVHLAMLPAGGPPPGSRIELLEATSPDSTIARFIEKRGPGLHHIALRVDDFEAVIERLRSQNVRLLNEPRSGAGGHIYVFIHPASTDGVLLELIQK